MDKNIQLENQMITGENNFLQNQLKKLNERICKKEQDHAKLDKNMSESKIKRNYRK